MEPGTGTFGEIKRLTQLNKEKNFRKQLKMELDAESSDDPDMPGLREVENETSSDEDLDPQRWGRR